VPCFCPLKAFSSARPIFLSPGVGLTASRIPPLSHVRPSIRCPFLDVIVSALRYYFGRLWRPSAIQHPSHSSAAVTNDLSLATTPTPCPGRTPHSRSTLPPGPKAGGFWVGSSTKLDGPWMWKKKATKQCAAAPAVWNPTTTTTTITWSLISVPFDKLRCWFERGFLVWLCHM